MNERDPHGGLADAAAAIKLDVPIMFSAMSFGSISLNAQKALAMAAERAGHLLQLRRGRPAQRSRSTTAITPSCRWPVGPLRRGPALPRTPRAMIEIKIGQGAKPGIGGHLPGEKINDEVSRTRMIPKGTDAI